MVHDSFEFEMPAPAEVVFDAFHYHQWRSKWDSLVNATHVIGGAPCPHVGAVTSNAGGGFLRPLSMETQFISYDRPRVAAATMRERSFPFARWAASMRHRPLPGGRSVMVYTYSFDTQPRLLRWLLNPAVKLVFDWQTRKRFKRMQAYLADQSHVIQAWQRAQRP